MTSARVLKGAEILDAHFKAIDWRSEIDTDSLVMDDSYRCILGQLFGNYHTGCEKLGLDCNSREVCTCHIPRRAAGFSTEPGNADDWTALEWEWKNYLKGQTNDRDSD